MAPVLPYGMGEVLQQRLKMSRFESPTQEALLALMVTASEMRANMDRVLAANGITGEQYNILRILRGAGSEGHPSGEIACRMVDRAPDVTRRIDALEKLDFVQRERSTGDRRVVQVRITPKGLDAIEAIAPRLREFELQVTKHLSSDELASLAGICEKLIEAGRRETD